jgi:metal-sulfur cluster biosynthetic enzyme
MYMNEIRTDVGSLSKSQLSSSEGDSGDASDLERSEALENERKLVETVIPVKAVDDIGRATAIDVREALHQVIDPELGIDVVDLGLVYEVEIDELGRAIITMTLTTPACPLTSLIEDECAEMLAGLVDEFRINWTWKPRWTVAMITPAGKEQLAALGHAF